MGTLQGILERIVYENPDTGYTVGRLSARDHAELITVVGNLASINPGESLLLQGEWVDNAKYGRQFQIEKYETILPANVVGLRKYLGSGLIKGIGPKIAGLIVRRFGMDTMDVIENEPEKLARVPGIGRKRVQIIKEAWEAQREIKNVMLFLQSHDVSTAHAAKIYKTYGNDAILIVTENPYRLADDIYGIGFVQLTPLHRNSVLITTHHNVYMRESYMFSVKKQTMDTSSNTVRNLLRRAKLYLSWKRKRLSKVSLFSSKQRKLLTPALQTWRVPTNRLV